jgi:hypothetical protein
VGVKLVGRGNQAEQGGTACLVGWQKAAAQACTEKKCKGDIAFNEPSTGGLVAGPDLDRERVLLFPGKRCHSLGDDQAGETSLGLPPLAR